MPASEKEEETEFLEQLRSDDGWQDPALAAAHVMLLAAFEESGMPADRAGLRGEILLVTVPSAEWVQPCRNVWQAEFLPEDAECGDANLNGPSPYAVFFAADKAVGRRESEVYNRAMTAAVACGALVVGISQDTLHLPHDLAAAASFRLRTRALGPEDFARLAERLCGGTASSSLTDRQAARAEPRILRLAKRPGVTADRFLERLAALAENEESATWQEEPWQAPHTPPGTKPTLGRLHGMDEAVAWGESLKKDLDAYREGSLGWNDVDRGALLSGPTGCGKTTFARALAASCGVRLVSGSYSSWLGSGTGHQGDLLTAMRRTFSDAKALAPSIVFIDEIDSFPDRATITHRHREWDQQVVNALLAEIDGVDRRPGVVVLGACNFPERLDAALVRAGRLDRHIRIGLPDAAGLALILREHLGDDAPDADLGRAALFLSGSTGADCESVVRGARRRARSAGRPLEPADLFEEILHGDGRSPAELRTAALHEAGHAAVAAEFGFELRGATIRSRGSSGGVVSIVLSGGYLSAEDVEMRLCVLLAGRAAEEILLGKPTSGAGGGPGSDLARATLLATGAVADWGLGQNLIWTGAPTAATLAALFHRRAGVTRSVADFLERAYDRTLDLVRKHGTSISDLAEVLIARGAVVGAEATAILRPEPVKAPASPAPSSAPRWLMPHQPWGPTGRPPDGWDRGDG